MADLYREAVVTSSPTLPPGGYVGYRDMKEGATQSGVEANLEFDTQGSLGNPGLEVVTASR